MHRLSVVDEMFLRSHRGLGTPIAMQGLWRFDGDLDDTLLTAVHDRLATGPLGRRVRRSAIPGARPYWVATSEAIPLVRHGRSIDDVFAWANAQATNLDPSRGPGWRLSTASTDDGGTVVSIVCSHVLSDARGLVLAVDRALTGAPEETSEYRRTSNWADAAHTWAMVARNFRPRAVPHTEPRPRRGETDVADVAAAVDVSAEHWDRAAAADGGTANSLFVAIVTGLLRSSGALPADASISAAVPIDKRASTWIGNAMAMAQVDVGPQDGLAAIRTTARDAFTRPMSGPPGIPDELLQVVPDRIAYLMARGSGERDVLCSNIGTVPQSLSMLGDRRSTGVAMRAVHPGLTPAHLRRLRTRLSGYLCRNGAVYTLTLVGLDPRHIASSPALVALADRELTRWGLRGRWW